MSSKQIPAKIVTPDIPKDSVNVNFVYEPAEDSFLFLDALEQELQFILNQVPSPPLCLEVGCGSGILSTALCQTPYFKENVTMVYGIDINPHACALTKETAELNCKMSKIETIQANGEKCSKMFNSKFDLILCNPPYVPTNDGSNEVDEVESKTLVASWDGGQDGNQFIIPFLQDIPQLLTDKGALYLLLSSWNNPDYLIHEFIPELGLKGELILKRAAGRERLSVWKITSN